MRVSGWQSELLRAIGLAAAALFIGLTTEHWGWAFFGAFAALTAWHLVQMQRVERWLDAGASPYRAPTWLAGIWFQTVERIRELQHRNRRRKRRLGDLLNRFHQSTEALPDAAVVLGRRNEIEWANGAAWTLLGIRNPGDQGRALGELLDDPRLRTHLEGEAGADSVDIASPVDPTIELNVRVVAYGDGQALLLARDASSLRRIEAMRRDFVANVSHELRTPLTVISGYVEAFRDEALPDSVREDLEAVERQSRRMLAIIEDLLMLARLESEPPDPTAAELLAITPILEELVDDARRLANDDPSRITLVADAELRLRGARTELTSAFANLIHNAVQHTPAGTRIDIAWRRCDGQAVLEVRDHGPGIAAEHLPRLAERFYRVDKGRSRASGGTGLGLALVKHAVGRNGGSLEIESHPGAGSTFRCVFSIASAPVADRV